MMLFFLDIALGRGLLLLSLCIECSFVLYFGRNKFIFIPLRPCIKKHRWRMTKRTYIGYKISNKNNQAASRRDPFPKTYREQTSWLVMLASYPALYHCGSVSPVHDFFPGQLEAQYRGRLSQSDLE